MKVGDEVKVIADYSMYYNNSGYITEILEGSGLPYTVVFDDTEDFNYFSPDEIYEVVSCQD